MIITKRWTMSGVNLPVGSSGVTITFPTMDGYAPFVISKIWLGDSTVTINRFAVDSKTSGTVTFRNLGSAAVNNTNLALEAVYIRDSMFERNVS